MPAVLALIPARGGSKGLPGKNLMDLGGRPLIAHTIAHALGSRCVERVLVSTDDPRIAAVAREHGAEVPFLRPLELAGDRSDVKLAVQHALDHLERDGYRPEALAVLFPTSPFRPAGLLDLLAARLDQGFAAARTVKPLDPARGRTCRLLPDGRLAPLDLPAGLFHRPYGLCSVQSFQWPRQRGIYAHLLDDPLGCIDIDTLEDMLLARRALAAGLVPEAGA